MCYAKRPSSINIQLYIVSVDTQSSVFFTADTPTSKTLTSGQDVIFQRTISNEGSGYNATTGRFTCTIPGLYLFTIQHCVETGRHSHMKIVKNDLRLMVGAVCGATGGPGPCTTVQAYVRLQAGEHIWARASYASYLYDDVNRMNAFSGALIQKN